MLAEATQGDSGIITDGQPCGSFWKVLTMLQLAFEAAEGPGP